MPLFDNKIERASTPFLKTTEFNLQVISGTLPLLVEEDGTFPSLFCISEKNSGGEPTCSTPELSTSPDVSSVMVK